VFLGVFCGIADTAKNTQKHTRFLGVEGGMIDKLRGNLLVLAAAILWGTTGTSQALAPVGATPLVIGALRLLVGGLALLVYALARRSFRQGDALSGLPRRSLAGAVICMAAYQVLFFGGVARTGVAVGTIVGIGSSPILGGVLGYLFAGERPGRPWGIATLLAVVGVGLLAANGSEIHVDLLGLLMAAGAGGAYAAFTLFNKQLLNGRRPEAVQAMIFLLSALLLSPVLLGANLSWVAQPAGILVVLHLGLVTLALAYTLFSLGLQRVGVSTAVTLTLAEPMTAAILGVTLLGEALTLQAGLGIVLIFGGLAFLSIKPQK
jgi:DME family drug/metabolite transporter